MANESIVFNGYCIEYIETQIPVIKRGFYLAKTLHVYIDGLENAVVKGYIPQSKTPVVLGSTGVVRILEPGYNVDPGLSGSIAIVKPLSRNGVVGLDIDGLLSRYTSIPSDTLLTTVSDDKPEYTLLYSLATGLKASSLAEGKRYLVIGAGLSGIASALTATNTLETTVYTEDNMVYRILRRQGVSVYRKWSELHGCYDIVYYSSLSTKYMGLLDKILCGEAAILLNPLYARVNSIALRVSIDKIVIEEVRVDKEAICRAYSLLNKFKRYVKTIEVDTLKQIQSLIPVRSLGVIVSIKPR